MGANASQSNLYKAVEQNDVEVVRSLVNQNVDVNVKKGGVTSLHLAAKSGNKEILKLLLDSSNDVNVKVDAGYTPLHVMVAYFKDNIEGLTTLLDSGADINAKSDIGDTALHLAVLVNNASLIEYLLSRGSEIDLKDQSGFTPLHLATQLNKNNSHLDVAEALLKNGADVHAKNNIGNMPLNYLLDNKDELAEKSKMYELFLRYSIKSIEEKNQDRVDETLRAGVSDEEEEEMDDLSEENKATGCQIKSEDATTSNEVQECEKQLPNEEEEREKQLPNEEEECKKRSWESIDRKIDEIYEEIKKFKEENRFISSFKLVLMHTFLLVISVLSYTVFSSLT